MKLRIFVAAAAIALFGACSSSYRASDTSTVVVTDATQSAFSSQYPNASNVVWTNYNASLDPMIDWDLAGWSTLESGDYVVRFNMDGDDYYAWYDNNGNWIGTAYLVSDYKTLPSAVTTTLNTQFPSYTITKVHRELQKDRVTYEVVLKRSSDDAKVKLLINSDGTVIRQKIK